MNQSKKSTIKRAPKRGHYDKKTIYSILDASRICHVAFVHHGAPVVIPTIFGRHENRLFIHGATVSRLITELEMGLDISLSVAHVDGLVLARSAFHHSMNYRSVVVFGTAKRVKNDEKSMALKIISDHLLPGRWEEVRAPNDKELKATTVLEIQINEASAKIRTGGPIDEPSDYDLPIWAGEIPLREVPQEPITDPEMKMTLPGLPESVKKFMI